MAEAAQSRTQQVDSILEARRAQGYRIESHNDQQAVVTMRSRRRFFNLRRGKEDVRYLLSFDEQGRASSRRIELAGQSQ